MKRYISLLLCHGHTVVSLLLIIIFSPSLSSQHTIEGRVVDKAGPLQSASVIVLNKVDSLMAGFGIANAQGKFRVEGLASGSYILQTSFLGYLDNYSEILLSPSDNSKSLGDIILNEGQMKLDEIVITADHVPVKFNSDTIQYSAAAFNVKAHEAVEDLLKKLPGVEVAKDGSIKAQGESVNKVLVEGKEFFGNDPTIATRNLPADAIDKVEVFDKKSEMAEFSGIDDGMEQKTINLSLKEDRKKGFFGNGKGALGTDERYNAKFNINSFKGDATWTAIGMANNVNEQGFSVMDYIDFMGGLGSFAGGGGRISIDTEELGLPVGQDLGKGFVNTTSGGINYNEDLNDKSELSGSYFYSRIDNNVDRTTIRQNLLQNQSYDTNEEAETNTLSNGHTLNLKYQSKIDSSQRLTIGGNLNYNNGSSSSILNRVLSTGGIPQNSVLSDYDSNGDRVRFGLNGTYSKRLGKQGRIFSINGRANNRDNNTEALIHSLNMFYPNPNAYTLDTLEQRQLIENASVDYQVGISFTEPLGRQTYLEANFSHLNNSNDYRKDFYDIMSNRGDQESLNTLLSDFYDRSFLYNRIGLNYKVNRKKYNLTLGFNLQHSDQQGMVGSSEFSINKDYLSVLPTIRYVLDLHTTSTFRMDYFTNISEPSLQQLQPQLDNSDPLNLYQGNPNLRPEYSSSFKFELPFIQFIFRCDAFQWY